MKLSSNIIKYQDINLHPCVVNNKSCIVYPKGLKRSAPELFKSLSHYFTSKGFLLKEDQRNKESATQYKNERRRWIPILLFSATMFLENTASANPLDEKSSEISNNLVHHKVELRLISNTQNLNQNYQIVKLKKGTITKSKSFKSGLADIIYNILNDHYVKQDSDPDYIQADLKEMANYYSGFPQAIKLIKSIKQKEWTLVFDESTWSTVAKGSILHVEQATIHFNTRSAAKLKLHNSCNKNPVCIASPADALLHEMLHTQSMLIYTDKFISQGGMNTQHYPWQYENSIIKLERELYASMSLTDTKKRPQRNEHTGRKVNASCATCIN